MKDLLELLQCARKNKDQSVETAKIVEMCLSLPENEKFCKEFPALITSASDYCARPTDVLKKAYFRNLVSAESKLR